MFSCSRVFDSVSPILFNVDDFVLENNMRIIWSRSFAGLAINISTYNLIWYYLEGTLHISI